MTTLSTQAVSTVIRYQSVEAAGIEIFYREVGNPEAPTVCCYTDSLLHRICSGISSRRLPTTFM